MKPPVTFSNEEATRVISRALWMVMWITLVVAPLVWWKAGWQSAALLVVGSAVSAAGLWKWMRLMGVVLIQMDDAEGSEGPKKANPMPSVLIWFFLTLGLMLAVLYVSLKYLDGSVYALAAGLAMGILTLTIEALRMVKAWTV